MPNERRRRKKNAKRGRVAQPDFVIKSDGSISGVPGFQGGGIVDFGLSMMDYINSLTHPQPLDPEGYYSNAQVQQMASALGISLEEAAAMLSGQALGFTPSFLQGALFSPSSGGGGGGGGDDGSTRLTDAEMEALMRRMIRKLAEW